MPALWGRGSIGLTDWDKCTTCMLQCVTGADSRRPPGPFPGANQLLLKCPARDTHPHLWPRKEPHLTADGEAIATTRACLASARCCGSTQATATVVYVFSRVTVKPRAWSPVCAREAHSRLHPSCAMCGYCGVVQALGCTQILGCSLIRDAAATLV